MSLIGRFVDQILPVGSITLIQPDGSRETHGPGGGRHVTVKFHDRRVGFDLFRNPRLRLGELYMDRRLTVEDGTILDLLELITGAEPWEQGRRKGLGKGKAGKFVSLFRRNPVTGVKIPAPPKTLFWKLICNCGAPLRATIRSAAPSLRGC